MKNEDLVPLVMIPRFSTYAGRATPSQCFSTIGMDVTEYDEIVLNVWRGNVVGSVTPGFRIWFEESTDQDAWTPCNGAPGGTEGDDPGENREGQFVLAIRKRWFRVRLQLGGADNVVTCWAVGYLHLRAPRRAAAAKSQASGDAPAPQQRPGGFGGFFRR